MYWILFYDNVPDYLERRTPLRSEHLRLAKEAESRGELVMAGALADPPDRSVIIFKTDDPKVIERFVAADPYVKNGLVTKWTIRKWNAVIGVTPP